MDLFRLNEHSDTNWIFFCVCITLLYNVRFSITNVLWLDVTGMWPVSLRIVRHGAM